jgi:hypothetical protein
MSTSALPQELIDKIIDAAEDDVQILKVLALVSTQWTPRTRKHLLKLLRLGEQLSHPLDPITRCRRLVEILEANRGLRNHPETLVIQCSTTDTDAEEKDRSLGWIQVCSEELIKILHMLRRSVNAVTFSQGATAMNFAHLSPTLREALHSFVARPNIVDLSLLGVHSMEMTSMVEHRSMEQLFIAFSAPPQAEIDAFLSKFGVRDLEQQPASTIAPLPSSKRSVSSKKFLRTLTVCGGGHALYLLLSKSQSAQATLDFSRIISVTVGTVHWDQAMAMIWPYYLKSFCQNVQSYCVLHGPWKLMRSDIPDETTLPFDPAVFSFDQLPRLRYLTVEVPHFSLSFPQHNPIPHLLEGLETLASSPKPVPLKRLTLDFNFGSLNGVDDVTKVLAEVLKRQNIWGRLDEILSRRVFSSLTDVTVDMLIRRCKFDQSVDELDELKSAMLSYMPNLGEQSKIKVIFYLPS